MNHYGRIRYVLQSIDETPQFSILSENQITQLFRDKLQDLEGKVDELSLAEFYAFTLFENSPTSYPGFYFGSPSSLHLSGERHDNVTFNKLTCEVIKYWKTRASASSHPILVARYKGLTWDFEQKICGTKSDIKTIARPYIISLLRCIDQELITGFSNCREKLRRALTLSQELGQRDLIITAIQTILKYQQQVVKPNACGTWLVSFELLIQSRAVKEGTTEYNTVMNWVHKWFDTAADLLSPSNDVCPARDVFELLFKELTSRGKNDEALRILQQLDRYFEVKFQSLNAGQTIHWLEILREYYQKIGQKQKVAQIEAQLEKLGPRLFAEMTVFRTENTFSKDFVDAFTERVLASPPERIFKVLVQTFVLDSENEREVLNQQQVHVRNLLTTQLYSERGVKKAIIGPKNDDKIGNLIQHLRTQITFSTVTMYFTLREAKERGILTKKNFLEFANKSSVLPSERMKIVDRAFEAYLANDFVVFLHLIIPQIEAACLTIVKDAGESVFSENAFGGYNVIVLNQIFGRNSFRKIMGTKGVDYFVTLFSDQRGFNLRNDIAHGLKNYEDFDETSANLVFISLLHLVASTSVNNASEDHN